MVRVYIAGKLNADAVNYIRNVHRMNQTAKMVRDEGFFVYVPCNDLIEGLIDGEFDYEDYFNNSQPWLLVSQAVFLVPGWEESKGTLREIELAKSKKIPVFDDLEQMVKFFFSYTE